MHQLIPTLLVYKKNYIVTYLVSSYIILSSGYKKRRVPSLKENAFFTISKRNGKKKKILLLKI